MHAVSQNQSCTFSVFFQPPLLFFICIKKILYLFSVEWPTCLKMVANTATQAMKSFSTVEKLEECFYNCKNALSDDCSYWTYNLTDKNCQFFSILKASTDPNITDVLSGEKYCTGQCKRTFFPRI